VPLLLQQPSSDVMRALVAAKPSITVWWGTVVECSSAIASAQRRGGITPAAAEQALSELRKISIEWQEVEPTERLREMAQRMLRLHPLRAADALQLAAALVAADGAPGSVEFV
jgi:predicted nucleic acid-binding protein